jgi:chemotaxis signal transduction protein
MKKPFKQPVQLLDQRNALSLYLHALLNEVDVEEESGELQDDSSGENALETSVETGFETKSATDINNLPQQGKLLPQAKAGVAISSQAPVVSMDIRIRAATVEAGHQSSSTPQNLEQDDTAVIENSEENKLQLKSQLQSQLTSQLLPPAWAQQRFQVLTFTLGTLQVAAPLEKLNGIIPLPSHITSLPGQSPWFLGLVRNRDKNVQLVDLAKIIKPAHIAANAMPGKEQTNVAQSSKYILLVEEGHWGILCDAIATVLTLEPQQVTWRCSSHFDFILGTVVEKMHSILCVDRLVERLNGRSI